MYLLDTNAVIAILNGKPPQVRRALVAARAAGHTVMFSSIVLHELWYGALRSQRPRENLEAVRKLLQEGFDSFPFDNYDAEAAGALRAALADAGKPIGPYDVLIAAQALRHGATLVTANEREFARVTKLKWKNWAA